MKKDIFISPSIMCCDLSEIPDYVKIFTKLKVKNIHFDVMDGHFVKNIMLGSNFYRDLKKMTNIPIDIHLMCMNPENFINYLSPRKGDWVCFHPETCKHSHRLLQIIKSLDCKAGIVLDPETPIDIIDELIDMLDYITIMAVNPGFAGQKMVPSHLDKLSRVSNKINNKKIDIIVDGNTTVENAKRMVENGATGLIVGTSSLIKGTKYFNDNYENYKEEVKN